MSDYRTRDRATVALCLGAMIGAHAGVGREVVDTDRFFEDLGMDSLDTTELLLDVEDEFGVTVSDAEAEKLETFGEFVDLLCVKLGIGGAR